tara:strand:- start:336 stop:806 length:471 start_codon:yes stop_codon:yes gene_type:complete
MATPISIKIEKALAFYLEQIEAFDDINIVSHSSVDEAPDFPSIIIHCQQTSRLGDTPLEMYAKAANVTASLFYDCDDGLVDLPLFEDAARELECALENLSDLQEIFNYDELEIPDERPVQGLHLHYIDEFQTDNETDDMTWQFGVGMTLNIEEVDD